MKKILKHNPLTSNIGLIFATVIWGSTFIVVKDSLANIDAITMICYRFGLAAIILGIILLFMRKDLWRNLKEGLILSLMLFLFYVVQTLGLKYIHASDSGFITGVCVIFVPIFGFFIGKMKLHWSNFLAMILASIGLWVITGGVSDFKLGEFLTLLGAAIYAVYILYVDRVVKKCDVWVLNFQQFLFIALASLVCMLVFNLPFKVSDVKAYYSVIYLAIFANVVAYMLQLRAQQFVTALACAIILSLEPVFAAMFAWTLGGEPLAMSDLIGGFLILVAIVIAQISEFKKKT